MFVPTQKMNVTKVLSLNYLRCPIKEKQFLTPEPGQFLLPFIFIFEQCDQNEQPVKCLESRFSIAPKKLTSLGLRIDNALKHPELYYSIYLPLDASF